MERLRVIEFGTFLAGPLAGRHLRSLGCHVVAVRRPPHLRRARDEQAYMECMRHDIDHGKEVVVADLPREQERALALVRDADILIENFSPGVMDRLGLDAQTCRRWNPRLIYVSMPGFARNDDEFRGVGKAWDSMLMAAAGLFCNMGLNRTLLGAEASYSHLPLGSVYGSVFATFACLCAVYGERWGTDIEVPLASSIAEALVHNTLQFPKERCYQCARAARIADGDYPVTERELCELQDPFFAKYRCADARTVYLVCPAHAGHQMKAARALGIEEEVRAVMPFVDPYAETFASGIGVGSLDRTQAAAVRPLLARAFARHASTVWEARLGEAGVPAIAHRTMQEWMQHSHAKDSGLVTQDAEGRCRLAPIGWLHPESLHGLPRRTATPSPARRNRSASAEEEGARPSPLAGVRVLDLTNVIAGPTVGAMFAQMGADVLKIDPPSPTYAPDIAVVYGLATNIGKRSLLLDVTHPMGRRAFDALLRDADVVIINCTHGALERLRMRHADLLVVNPDVVLVHFDAWGGPLERGAFAEYVGYDDNVQAAIGIMERFGGSLETAEEHAHVGTIDVIAGVAAAAVGVRALLRRKREGVVCTARASLASVGQYLQYPFMFRKTPPSAYPGRGIRCRGENPLHCCYRVSDGWILLAPPTLTEKIEGLWPAIRSTFGATADGEIEDIEMLETELSKRTASDALALVRAIGCSALRLSTLETIRLTYEVDEFRVHGPTFQFLCLSDHPIGRLRIIAPIAFRFHGDRWARHYSSPSPKYGKDTLGVLGALHLTKLLHFKVASCAWSRHYMPFSMACDLCAHQGRSSILLECEHKLCSVCARSAMRKTCPVCGVAHETDPKRLRALAGAWKTSYGDWRRGGFRGAKDWSRMVRPRALRRIKSESDLGRLLCATRKEASRAAVALQSQCFG